MNNLTDTNKTDNVSKIKLGPLNFIELSRITPTKRSSAERKIDFKEIYPKSENIPLSNQAARCLDCGNPYCEWKCPLHNYIPNWLELVAKDQHQQAGELMYQTNPLPEICGRVCPQDRLCEQACTINTGFGAVTIGSIEKNITDELLAKQWRPDLTQVELIGKCVSIIGAGPAGLACADQLVRNGIKPVVYDRYPEIGGLLTFGIPGFKLEKDVMRKRRKFLEDLGVIFKLNINISDETATEEVSSENIKSEKSTNHSTTTTSFKEISEQSDAVFLAMGTYTSVQANLPGNDSKGVIRALDYLIGNVSHIEKYKMDNFEYHNLENKNVVVIGGGDTAMDCVRTAIRQAAKSVSCVYRRDQESMPGSPKEVSNAMEEGVEFLFNLAPMAIEQSESQNSEKKVSGLRVQTTKQIYDKQSGKSSLEVMPESEQILEADIIITAFGFKASPAEWFQNNKISTLENGLVKTKSSDNHPPLFTQQTSNTKVFAGGDMVRGADLVVTAIADGIKGAQEIIKLLSSR